ncbi:MAG TPA: (d)CMP kinase, partial [Allosphingosinicella sp.]
AALPGGAVLDGRDIGTVIAPHAEAKLFVTATPEVRARRRFAELVGFGLNVHYEDVLADIRARDERDSGRVEAPLRPAPDAHILDTSEMSAEQAVQAAIDVVERLPA